MMGRVDDDFYVDDEPVEDVLAEYRRGRRVVVIMSRRAPVRRWAAAGLRGAGVALERLGERIRSRV